EMTDLPQPLRARLVERFSIGKIDIISVLGSRDTTRKFLFRLSDGNLIESVLIPASPASGDCGRAKSDRGTVCVPTDVGCASDCNFFASGLDVFSRNVRGAELGDQFSP